MMIGTKITVKKRSILGSKTLIFLKSIYDLRILKQSKFTKIIQNVPPNVPVYSYH